MKEIKAYVRCSKAEEVMCALEKAGVPGFTAIKVKGLGGASVPEKEILHIDYSMKYCPITKLEIVCKDEDAERIVDVVKKKAYTGHRGDGMIFVSDVGKAVKIRTGDCGESALLKGTD